MSDSEISDAVRLFDYGLTGRIRFSDIRSFGNTIIRQGLPQVSGSLLQNKSSRERPVFGVEALAECLGAVAIRIAAIDPWSYDHQKSPNFIKMVCLLAYLMRRLEAGPALSAAEGSKLVNQQITAIHGKQKNMEISWKFPKNSSDKPTTDLDCNKSDLDFGDDVGDDVGDDAANLVDEVGGVNNHRRSLSVTDEIFREARIRLGNLR